METLFDAVIFDLDGTLLDTLDDIRDSLNHTLRLFGLPEQGREDVRRHLGNGSARLVELSMDGGRANPLYPQVLEAYSQWYDAHANLKTRPYPGMPEAIRQLTDLGVKVAIVSNKPDAAVQTLNDSYFRVNVAVGERPGVRRKPAPDAVLAALERLGAAPDRAVYVGDSEVDLMTAGNAGLPCVCVSWGFRDREQLAEAGAACIADDAEALLALLI